MSLVEEERAAEHRRQLQARCQWRCEMVHVTLAGDDERRRQLGLAWAAPVEALLEAQNPEPLHPDGSIICTC